MQNEEILPGLTNASAPWSRQSRVDPVSGKTTIESGQAWSAFCTYRDLGEDRSLARVAEQCGKSVSLMERWSVRWNWRERSKAFDDHLDAEMLKGMMSERIRMGQRQARLGMKGQALAGRLLEELGAELTRPVIENIGGRIVRMRRRPTASETARLLDVSSRLEQSCRGVPREDAVANVIVHIELQSRPRYESEKPAKELGAWNLIKSDQDT